MAMFMNVYIFSNIKCNKKIKTNKDDILVFLNDAISFKEYIDCECKKILFRRWLISKQNYAGKAIKNIDNFYIRGNNDNLLIDYK